MPWSRREAAKTPGQLVISWAPGSRVKVVGQSHGPGSSVRIDAALEDAGASVRPGGRRRAEHPFEHRQGGGVQVLHHLGADHECVIGEQGAHEPQQVLEHREVAWRSHDEQRDGSVDVVELVERGAERAPTRGRARCVLRFSRIATVEQYESTTTVGRPIGERHVRARRRRRRARRSDPRSSSGAQSTPMPGSTPAMRCSSSSSAASQARSSSRSRSGCRRSSKVPWGTVIVWSVMACGAQDRARCARGAPSPWSP